MKNNDPEKGRHGMRRGVQLKGIGRTHATELVVILILADWHWFSFFFFFFFFLSLSLLDSIHFCLIHALSS